MIDVLVPEDPIIGTRKTNKEQGCIWHCSPIAQVLLDLPGQVHLVSLFFVSVNKRPVSPISIHVQINSTTAARVRPAVMPSPYTSLPRLNKTKIHNRLQHNSVTHCAKAKRIEIRTTLAGHLPILMHVVHQHNPSSMILP